MLSIMSAGLAFFAAVLCIPTVTLIIEILFARLPKADDLLENPNSATSDQTAVIIPAHDESIGLLPTLNDVKAQLHSSDRLIVVADNCSDDTAAVAASAGAEVIERNDPDRIGKGYALAYGLAYLNDHPPEFVIFVDADCRLQTDMVPRLKLACATYKCPVQACFLMKAAEQSPISHLLAEFAWIIKNWARPLGLFSLGLPVQLMGTGMIFPWKLIKGASLASDNLVEDLKLGLDLAAAGHAPRFYPQVVGTSEFPQSAKGTDSQRRRWIQGHVSMIRNSAPKLLLTAIITRNWPLLVLVIDLAVPPISMLILLITSTFLAGLALLAAGAQSAVAVISVFNLLGLTGALCLAWLKFARELISLRDIALIIAQVCRRLPFYFGIYAGRKATSWIRTDRSKDRL
jgi:cellulose synthase/poly-beta-1,6-N-acetylglucosamine synthase-like glycosyltransferase